MTINRRNCSRKRFARIEIGLRPQSLTSVGIPIAGALTNSRRCDMLSLIHRLRKLIFPTVSIALLCASAQAATVPFGGTDGLCTPQVGGASNGVTTCLVNEGQGDTLLELVLNFTGVAIKVNSVTSGPIQPVAGDRGDFIITDPIANGGGFPQGAGAYVDCLTLPILNPGDGCTFNQSFTTDPSDLGPMKDGESTMSFIFGITPFNPNNLTLACGVGTGQRLGAGGLGLNYCFGANPTPVDGRGALLVQIVSADVTVNDAVPEPATLGIMGLALIFTGTVRRLRGKRSGTRL
jgi:hypothetical protein